MSRFPRPKKQFDFISLDKLSSQQAALLRRSNIDGTYFDDDTAAQSREQSEAIAEGKSEEEVSAMSVYTIDELEIAWSDAEGYEFKRPTYVTFTMEGQDLLKFRVGDEYHYMFYSNTRNLVESEGKLVKE